MIKRTKIFSFSYFSRSQASSSPPYPCALEGPNLIYHEEMGTAMVSFRNPRSRHPYHMHDMIRAQPAFLREAEGVLKDLDVRAFLGSPRSLVLTGCGTSFHAAMYGARVLQEAFGARARVGAAPAYDLLYGPAP